MSQINLLTNYSEHRTRQRLIEAAVMRLAQQELTNDLLSEITAQVGCSTARANTFFDNSEELVLALYARFAGDLEARILELPEGTLAERFDALMRIKFELMMPYRQALLGLAKTFSDHHSALGIFSPQTEIIRIRVQAVLSAVVQGATDYRGSSADSLARSLYATYLGLMWLWYKDKSAEKQNAQAALKVARSTLSLTAPFLTLPQFELPLKGFDKIQQSLLMPTEDSGQAKVSSEILRVLFKHRRLQPDSSSLCGTTPCEQCLALHLPRVKYFVGANRPIHLVLPAFPAKSPNRRKTFGALPDKAEEQALIYLEKVCEEICERHAPGVRLTICSDGHVFSDLVGVSDTEVTLYSNEIRRMINRLNSNHIIDTFSLPDLYEDIRHYLK